MKKPKYADFIPDDLYDYVFRVCGFRKVSHGRGAVAAGPVHPYIWVTARTSNWFLKISQLGDSRPRLYLNVFVCSACERVELQLDSLDDLRVLHRFVKDF